mmetsp:Transcript_15223/g.30320  ORF Transcript_15223/g.30320 Transcript_15223/m.30320 type:complete len:231 (-) Transcript_15223:336-1028(-)
MTSSKGAAPEISFPPYSLSPTMGQPKYARWTRIWWPLPVAGSHSTRSSPPPHLLRRLNFVLACLPSSWMALTPSCGSRHFMGLSTTIDPSPSKATPSKPLNLGEHASQPATLARYVFLTFPPSILPSTAFTDFLSAPHTTRPEVHLSSLWHGLRDPGLRPSSASATVVMLLPRYWPAGWVGMVGGLDTQYTEPRPAGSSTFAIERVGEGQRTGGSWKCTSRETSSWNLSL